MPDWRRPIDKITSAFSESHPDGFALLLVAVAIAILSLIFGAALGTARQHAAGSDAALDRTRMLAAVEGAIVKTEYDLVTGERQSQIKLGQPFAVRIGATSVNVKVRPETAKLDLNGAPESLLARYFETVGVARKDALAIGKEIAHRRRTTALGQEDADRGSAQGGRFESVGELRDLPRVSDDLYDCAEQDLTVFTQSSTVDWPDASPRLRSVHDNSVDGNRPSESFRGTGAAGELFEVTARAEDALHRQTASRETILRITGASRHPVWILAQTTPAPNTSQSNAACDRVRAAGQGKARSGFGPQTSATAACEPGFPGQRDCGNFLP